MLLVLLARMQTTNFQQFTPNGATPRQQRCNCIKACLLSKNICDNYVWKFVDNSGKRKCTLYR